MRILIAPNAFKGTLSGEEVATVLESALRPLLPGAVFEKQPVSDGGDGLIDTLAPALGGRVISAGVSGPLGGKVKARLCLAGKTAIMEMAEASGLKLIKHKAKRPMEAGTAGVGELINKALTLGAREIIIGLGGSASNDGGAGCAAAFGFKLLDKKGNPIGPGVRGLLDLACVSGLEAAGRLKEVKVRALADVINPLCGRRGSARVYGPQKGAGPAQVRLMEKALMNYAAVIKKDIGPAVAHLERGAAAGGLGAGLYSFFGAELLDGAGFVLEKLDFKTKVKAADLVITGEGCFDSQTFSGKAPAAVAAMAKICGKPLVMVCGSSRFTGKKNFPAAGITAIVDASDYFSTKELLSHPKETLRQAVQKAWGTVSVSKPR
ncbi:MAG TPA: glycerate kinase [Elusimicrobia bacterium]|nr:glycerate kinase [Elusimicrobiota bacterium]